RAFGSLVRMTVALERVALADGDVERPQWILVRLEQAAKSGETGEFSPLWVLDVAESDVGAALLIVEADEPVLQIPTPEGPGAAQLIQPVPPRVRGSRDHQDKHHQQDRRFH